jgi:hypothetical protein
VRFFIPNGVLYSFRSDPNQLTGDLSDEELRREVAKGVGAPNAVAAAADELSKDSAIVQAILLDFFTNEWQEPEN